MPQETMKAVVFLGDRKAEVIELPIPSPGPGQVLVKIESAGICGSDMHVYRRPAAHFEGRQPWIPGHEPAGVIAERGEGCHLRQVGDRVSVYHYLACGHCTSCLEGLWQFCENRTWANGKGLGNPPAPGPDAEYMVVDEKNCLLLPDELTYDDGALIACGAGTTFAALRKLRPNGEDTLVVFGQGPVGLVGTAIAQAMGARVIAVDVVDERLAIARELGAAATVNAAGEDLVEVIHDLTGGRGADMALETSGAVAAHQGVIDVLRRNGSAVFVGLGSREPSVNLTRIIGKQLTLRGSFVMPRPYYDDLVSLMLRHDLSAEFAKVCVYHYPISEGVEAFRVADRGTEGKVMLVAG